MDLLVAAKRFEASDIHLAPGQPPALRVAGSFRNLKTLLSRDEIERAVTGLVPESRAAELRDHGGVSFAVDVPGEMRLRVNATVSLAGPKLAIRLVRKTPPTIEELGLPAEVARVVEQPQGLVLIVGPSGHGKTTTLAALVDAINRERAAHIIVVEDPMEIPIASKMSVVSQREVGRHAESFERALKGALRQDPDVIAVGELRDLETMRIALAASETGHLVIGTMNAPTASRAVERIIDVFPPAEQPQIRATLAGGLRLVMSQRLVPTQDGVGRAAAVEILPGMVQLWNLIREEKTYQLPGLMQRGRGLGITRLEDSLAALVEQGKITEAASREALHDADARPEPQRHAHVAAPDAAPTVGEAGEELLTGLLQKAGALFQRKGGS
jgi:twitching motility protein PilT